MLYQALLAASTLVTAIVADSVPLTNNGHLIVLNGSDPAKASVVPRIGCLTRSGSVTADMPNGCAVFSGNVTNGATTTFSPAGSCGFYYGDSDKHDRYVCGSGLGDRTPNGKTQNLWLSVSSPSCEVSLSDPRT
jgi:hypothetical protein